MCKIGGSVSGEYAEGRLRGLFNSKLFNPEAIAVFRGVKQAFDPKNTLNPGVKIDVKLNDVRSMVRDNYSLDHQYAHLPRS